MPLQFDLRNAPGKLTTRKIAILAQSHAYHTTIGEWKAVHSNEPHRLESRVASFGGMTGRLALNAHTLHLLYIELTPTLESSFQMQLHSHRGQRDNRRERDSRTHERERVSERVLSQPGKERLKGETSLTWRLTRIPKNTPSVCKASPLLN